MSHDRSQVIIHTVNVFSELPFTSSPFRMKKNIRLAFLGWSSGPLKLEDPPAEHIRQSYAKSAREADSAILCQIRLRSGFGNFMQDPPAEEIRQSYARSAREADSAILCQIRL